MSKDVSFVLDINAAGKEVLETLAAPLVQRSAEAIAARARSMASSMTSDPPEISVSTKIGTIKKGRRAIATVSAAGGDAHSNYVGHVALAKAKDAGRVN